VNRKRLELVRTAIKQLELVLLEIKAARIIKKETIEEAREAIEKELARKKAARQSQSNTRNTTPDDRAPE
jgi:hypothetical protein